MRATIATTANPISTMFHSVPSRKALFGEEVTVGLRSEACIRLEVVTLGDVAAIGALVMDGTTVSVGEGTGVKVVVAETEVAAGPEDGVATAIAVVLAAAAALEACDEKVAPAAASVSEAVGKGNDGTVSVPVYPGHPGTSLGGARPPPQSSSWHCSVPSHW